MKLKRLGTAALFLIEVFCYCFAVNAQNLTSPSINTELVESNGYHFAISTEETSAHQVVRHYTRSAANTTNSRTACSADLAETEALLLAMGWDQQMVDDLTYKDLQEYATCEQITTTVSYIRNTAQGEAEYISEQEALFESAAYATRPEEVSEVTYTSYMRLTHTVTYYGDALYRFSTDAIWMTMPLYRLKDSIGSCAPILAIVPGSAKGEYTYNYTFIGIFPSTEYKERVTGAVTPIDSQPNGDWYGSAGTFTLPKDASSEYGVATCSDFRVHYEFKAYLRFPLQETYFNTVGTYCHTKIAPALSPSISIEFGGNVSASIGFSLATQQDRTSAEILLHYIPE